MDNKNTLYTLTSSIHMYVSQLVSFLRVGIVYTVLNYE